MDVVVAGSGIIGCAAAYALSRRGFSVQVFDPRPIGGGATRATAGILAPFIEAPTPGLLHQLTLESFRQYDRFIAGVQADAGVDVEYRRCGTLELAESADDMARLTAVAELARAAAVDVEWRDWSLGGAVVRGLVISSQGYVRVEQLVPVLQRAAERHGARFHTGVSVSQVEPSADGVAVLAGDRRLTCAALVVAAGSWADSVAPEILGIRPVRGQLVRLHSAFPLLDQILWSHDCYLVPWLDGTILVGATVEDVGFDDRATGEGVRRLLDAACRVLPSLGDATFLEARAGLRPAAADNLPIIRSSARSARIIYACGHFRNGILLAPLTADRVADLVQAIR